MRPPPEARGALPLVEGGRPADGPRVPLPPYDRTDGTARDAGGADRVAYDGASKRRGAAAAPGVADALGALLIRRDEVEGPGVRWTQPLELASYGRDVRGATAPRLSVPLDRGCHVEDERDASACDDASGPREA